MRPEILTYIAVMALVTYLIRLLPLTLIRRRITNKYIRSFLYYVPYCDAFRDDLPGDPLLDRQRAQRVARVCGGALPRLPRQKPAVRRRIRERRRARLRAAAPASAAVTADALKAGAAQIEPKKQKQYPSSFGYCFFAVRPYFSKCAATVFRCSMIGRCCGQTPSHWPHAMHSLALPKSCVRFS